MAAKKDIAETAVHFVLKWGFEVNPVSNNSGMLETGFWGHRFHIYVLETGPVR